MRKKVKGVVYILKSTTGVYKYGATANRVRQRVRSANHLFQDKFEIITTRDSKDIYALENILKWEYINETLPISPHVEFFNLSPEGFTHEDVIRVFEAEYGI